MQAVQDLWSSEKGAHQQKAGENKEGLYRIRRGIKYAAVTPKRTLLHIAIAVENGLKI